MPRYYSFRRVQSAGGGGEGLWTLIFCVDHDDSKSCLFVLVPKTLNTTNLRESLKIWILPISASPKDSYSCLIVLIPTALNRTS